MKFVAVAHPFHQVNMHGHQHQGMVAAITEINLAQPVEHLHLLQAGFFADFTLGGVLGLFARFDMPFGDSPAVFGVLHQQDLHLAGLAVAAEDDAAGGSLADNFVNHRPTDMRQFADATDRFGSFHYAWACFLVVFLAVLDDGLAAAFFAAGLAALEALAVAMSGLAAASRWRNKVPSTPLMNLEELSPPKALASSTASLMTTLGGTPSSNISSYTVSYTHLRAHE